MKLSTVLAAGVLALAPSALQADPAGPPLGDPAPNFKTGQWFNHLGSSLDLPSLRGRAVLIEFWATW